ncbi:MAG: hypothetical protein IIV53_05670 [Bacteroidaceae bacterium]|nr:hypothetical protein [Bacteroidaceae bacterium]
MADVAVWQKPFVNATHCIGKVNAFRWPMQCIEMRNAQHCVYGFPQYAIMTTTYWPHTEKLRFLGINYGKNRSFFGKTASLYRKTTMSGKINCKFATDKLAFA